MHAKWRTFEGMRIKISTVNSCKILVESHGEIVTLSFINKFNGATTFFTNDSTCLNIYL